MSGEAIAATAAIIVALVTMAGTVYVGRRAAREMNALNLRKLEGEEFERQNAITQRLIENLRQEVERLDAQVEALLGELERERADNVRLLRMLREVTDTANSLRYKVKMLETRLNGGSSG